ncbi:MAG: hypothetical protein QNJ46_02335 [Leptolyngbyaceae cyanobacterium MO_188.B28]|nr:hypothetical protein [Leptolyngbyaceae cyanobacterium MO_188.B28]
MRVSQSMQPTLITIQNKVRQAQSSIDVGLDNDELTDEQLKGVIGGSPTSDGIWGPCLQMRRFYSWNL